MGGESTRSAAARGAGGRIADIEVLRALAVGMVLAHHSAVVLIPWVSPSEGLLYGHFGFGAGVDLFLAISGFVIGRSLLPTLPPPREGRAFFTVALSFWVRRAWRLLPSAWLWLIIAVLCAIAFNRSGAFETVKANVDGAVAAALNVANFHFAHNFARGPGGAVFHYWSLSLEEQFYLALPFVIFFARGRLPFVLVAIAASQFLIKRLGYMGDLMALMTRSDALCLGVLLAIWSQGAEYRQKEPVMLAAPLCRWLLLPAFLLVFASVDAPVFGTPRYTVGLLAVLSAAIVWVASYDRDYLFPPGPLKRAICWVGGRSYGIYLIHVPVYLATREVWWRLSPALVQPGLGHKELLLATALPVTLLIAELNFRLVEEPLRRHGARIAERIRRRNLDALGGAVQEAA